MRPKPDVQAARTRALQYSRELPTRQFSPYGGVGPDHEAIQEAFRECYEALRYLGSPSLSAEGGHGGRREFVEANAVPVTPEVCAIVAAATGWAKEFAIVADGFWLFGSEAELEKFEKELHG